MFSYANSIQTNNQKRLLVSLGFKDYKILLLLTRGLEEITEQLNLHIECSLATSHIQRLPLFFTPVMGPETHNT